MKIILGIIAFTITFGLSTGLVGILFGFPKAQPKSYVSKTKYSSAYKYKIDRLIKRDVRNGDLRDMKVRKLYKSEGYASPIYKAEYRKVITDYYIKSSSINDSNLPEDFKYAWREHMNAWKKQTQYLNSLTIDDSYSEDVDVAVKRYSDNTNEINSTWYQVLRIAERYGVNINSRYYR